ncbi:Hypothetical protein A7982_01137 [Minicystis rosea]|nr:Hypothetical protein A7982_01137 [Minicystis rosea]
MVRIVLPDAVSRDTLDDVAAALGLLLVNIVPATDAHPAQVIYVTPDRRAAVHLVDEGRGGSLCWAVRGEGQGESEAEAHWAEVLRAELRATEAS